MGHTRYENIKIVQSARCSIAHIFVETLTCWSSLQPFGVCHGIEYDSDLLQVNHGAERTRVEVECHFFEGYLDQKQLYAWNGGAVLTFWDC